MPVTWSVDSVLRRAILTFSDPYTLHEWEEAMRAVLATPELASGFSLLVDRRDAKTASVAFVSGMVRFFAQNAARLARTRVAVVVSNESAYGMARMTSTLGESRVPGFTIEAFYDYDRAEQWLAGRSDGLS
jgi:hypothetical protein